MIFSTLYALTVPRFALNGYGAVTIASYVATLCVQRLK